MSSRQPGNRRPHQRAGARARSIRVLILFAVYYLLPLYVMLVNSLKPLDEIRQGNMLALPAAVHDRALAQRLVDGADRRAADRAQAVFHQLGADGRAGGGDLDHARRAQRLRAHQVALPRRQHRVRADAVCLLHPVPDRADSDGAHPRTARPRRHDAGPHPGACGLRHRLHAPCSSATTTRRSRPSWSARRRSTAPVSSASSGASCCRARARSSW